MENLKGLTINTCTAKETHCMESPWNLKAFLNSKEKTMVVQIEKIE